MKTRNLFVGLFKDLKSHAAAFLLVVMVLSGCTEHNLGEAAKEVYEGIDWDSQITTTRDYDNDKEKTEKYDIYCTENGVRNTYSKVSLTLKGRATVATTAPEILHLEELPSAAYVSKDKGNSNVSEYPTTHNNWETLSFFNEKVSFQLDWSKQSELIDMCSSSKTFESGFTGYKVLPRSIEPTGETVVIDNVIREIFRYIQPFEVTHTTSGHSVTLYGDVVLFSLPKGVYNPEDPRVTEVILKDMTQNCESKSFTFNLTLKYNDGTTKEVTEIASKGDWGISIDNISDIINSSNSLGTGTLSANGSTSQYKSDATEGNFTYQYVKQPLKGTFSASDLVVTGYDWYTVLTYSIDDATLTLVNSVPSRSMNAVVSSNGTVDGEYNVYPANVYAFSQFVNCTSEVTSNDFKVKVKKDSPRVTGIKLKSKTQNCESKSFTFVLTLTYSDGSSKDVTEVASKGDWGISLDNITDVVNDSNSLGNGTLSANGSTSQYKSDASEGNFTYKYVKQPLKGTFSASSLVVTGYDWYTVISYTIDDATLTIINEVPARSMNATVSSNGNVVDGYNVYPANVYAFSKFVTCTSEVGSNAFNVKVKKDDQIEYKKENNRISYITDNGTNVNLTLVYDYNKYVNGVKESTETRTGYGNLSVNVPATQTKEVSDFTVTGLTATQGSWSGSNPYYRTWTNRTNVFNFAFGLTLSVDRDVDGDEFVVDKNAISLSDMGISSLNDEAPESGYEAVKGFTSTMGLSVSYANGTFSKDFSAKGILKKKEEVQEAKFLAVSAGSVVFDKLFQAHNVLVVANQNGKARFYVDGVDRGVRSIDASGAIALSANNFISDDWTVSALSGNTSWWLWNSIEPATKGTSTGEINRAKYETQGYHGSDVIYHTPTYSQNSDGSWKAVWTTPKGIQTVNNIPDPANW